MENVTVNYYPNGDIKAYLVVYDINDYEKELLRQGITVSLDDKTKTFLLENLVDNESEQNEIVARLRDFKMCTQWVTQSNTCTEDLHDLTNFGQCAYFQNGTWTPALITTLEFVPCPDSGGGPGGGDGGYIPPSDDQPVGGGPDNDDPAEIVDEFEGQITWPVTPRQHPKNCDNLRDLISANKQNIMPVIEFMEGKLDANTKNEWSASFKNTLSYDAETDISTVVYSNEYEEEGTESSSVITIGTDYFGGIHLHPKSNGIVGGIFSWLDIQTLLNTHQMANATLKEKATFMLVAPNPNNLNHYNLYSLRIENVNDLISKLNQDWNGPEMTGLNDEEKLLKINEEIGNGYLKNSGNLEKYFLERFGSYGISLYKGNPDSEYENWDRLELQNNAVVKRPCN